MLPQLRRISHHLSTTALSAQQLTRRVTASPIQSRIMTSTLPESSAQRMIYTAACLIIGDEVLGGKTIDTNSAYFAKYCFGLGINLKRIEVIADDETDIGEATRRMSQNYDFVVTSGGIGPTHDDITYPAIAKAFGLKLKLHEPTFTKMKRLSNSQEGFSWDVPSSALTAKLRMVEVPFEESRSDAEQYLFVHDDMWVPICVVNGNIHILPGIPRLFEKLLDGLRPLLLPRITDPEGKGIYRLSFATPMAESAAASYLTELAAKVESRGIKVGSYPRWGKKHNAVTLVGRDREFMESLVPEIERGIQGRKVSAEEECDSPSED